MTSVRSSAVEAFGLGKRYGGRWALKDCSLRIPAGTITALVGPNGAGKTTLLQLIVGVLAPSAGELKVLDGSGPDHSLLARVGFLPQGAPLYPRFRIRDIAKLGRSLNPAFDEDLFRDRMAELKLQEEQRVGELSGGERAQVALALAMGKRPELLLLDEPVASLDPVARRAFLGALMTYAADGDISLVLSSHLIADLQRVCDHLVVLAAGRVQLSGPIEELLSSHLVLTGPRRDRAPGGVEVIHAVHTSHQSTFVVRTNGQYLDPSLDATALSLEELVIAYMESAGEPSHSVSLVGSRGDAA